MEPKRHPADKALHDFFVMAGQVAAVTVLVIAGIAAVWILLWVRLRRNQDNKSEATQSETDGHLIEPWPTDRIPPPPLPRGRDDGPTP